MRAAVCLLWARPSAGGEPEPIWPAYLGGRGLDPFREEQQPRQEKKEEEKQMEKEEAAERRASLLLRVFLFHLEGRMCAERGRISGFLTLRPSRGRGGCVAACVRLQVLRGDARVSLACSLPLSLSLSCSRDKSFLVALQCTSLSFFLVSPFISSSLFSVFRGDMRTRLSMRRCEVCPVLHVGRGCMRGRHTHIHTLTHLA